MNSLSSSAEQPPQQPEYLQVLSSEVAITGYPVIERQNELSAVSGNKVTDCSCRYAENADMHYVILVHTHRSQNCLTCQAPLDILQLLIEEA